MVLSTKFPLHFPWFFFLVWSTKPPVPVFLTAFPTISHYVLNRSLGKIAEIALYYQWEKKRGKKLPREGITSSHGCTATAESWSSAAATTSISTNRRWRRFHCHFQCLILFHCCLHRPGKKIDIFRLIFGFRVPYFRFPFSMLGIYLACKWKFSCYSISFTGGFCGAQIRI